ncbi:hypothetical protein WG70_16370 [Burkholderia oklahomensis EO147]|nr:hypothetical protein WG70_16370 [Burkholderia oklahomensis EO147]KUY63777.1 hypothetical protein WG70_30040 [Burkholderia oklahomensis EO147]
MPFAYSIMRFVHDRAFARKTVRSPFERRQSRCDSSEQLSCAPSGRMRGCIRRAGAEHARATRESRRARKAASSAPPQ